MAEPVPSAVALIETPRYYVVQRRPDLPEVEYAGQLQFFGGHALVGDQGDSVEEPHDTITRELWEELSFYALPWMLRLVWQGPVPSSRYRQADGMPYMQKVSLFHMLIDSAQQLTLKDGGDIYRLPKTEEALEASRAEMTGFAHGVLTRAIRRQHGVEHHRS